MAHRALDSRHSIDSCALKLHNWRPFKLCSTSKALDSNGIHPKRPCLSDRATSFNIDVDLSKLSLIEDDKSYISAKNYQKGSLRLVSAGKRRRRGSRSVSGRSSDRSATRRCCSVGASAAHGTCSDFPVAVGTDSSGELFMNGDSNWASDVSEARNSRKEREEKETVGVAFGLTGGFDVQANESGYGSEPGYRGDAEFGYGDELDEEEEDAKLMFWGQQLGGKESATMEMARENTFSDQKSHHRCRRKKHDCRMAVSLRAGPSLADLVYKYQDQVWPDEV